MLDDNKLMLIRHTAMLSPQDYKDLDILDLCNMIDKYRTALEEIAKRENCTDECYCSSCVARSALRGDSE